MKRNVRLTVLIILFTMIFTTALSANNFVNYQNKSGTQTVTIDPNQVKFELVTANNKIVGSENIKSIINRTKPYAAINGNFFDAYKTLVPHGCLIKNGEVLYLDGGSGSFYIDSYGKPGIDSFSLTLNIKSEDTKIMAWYVNMDPIDKTGIYIFTPKKGNSIKLPGGSVMSVRNNIVTGKSYNVTSAKIPKDGYIVYFGPNAVAGPKRFKDGSRVEMSQKYPKDIFKSYKDKGLEVPKIENMVSAGPLLVFDGKNVANQYAKNMEAKIAKQRAQRSAVGISKAGKVIFATRNGVTVNELANHMIKLGCTSATNLDGGASSALYANGKYITNPGRNLNNMMIATKLSAPHKKAEPPKPKFIDNVRLFLNGEKIDMPKDFGESFLNEDGKTMIPVRFVSEILDYEVEWDNETRTVTIDGNIKIVIDNKIANVDGKDIELDTKAVLKNGRTYVPVRFISEALGHEVKYERDNSKTPNIEHKIDIIKD